MPEAEEPERQTGGMHATNSQTVPWEDGRASMHRRQEQQVTRFVGFLLLALSGIASAGDGPAPTNSLASNELTLTQAVAIALANNPEIAATRYDAVAAREQSRQAVGAARPSLHALGGYNRYLNSQRLIPARQNNEPGVFTENLFSGDLVLTQPLFTGGRLQNEIRAAELLSQASEHQLGRTRQQVVFDVSSLYYGILASRHVVESLKFSQQALREHLKQVEALTAAEKAADVDRLRIEVRLADIKQKILQAENNEALQRHALAALMGNMTQPIDLKVGGELAVPPQTVRVSTEDALAKAMQRRPDYLAARSSLDAQEKTLAANRAAHWPTLAVEADYGGRWATDPTDHPNGTRDAADAGWIGIVIDVPIFEGGRIDARVNEQRARLAASQERMRKLELQVRLEVETAVLTLSASHERLQAMQKAIEQAEESLRIEQKKYDVGRGAIVDVLDAQAALSESQTTYYQTLADYNTAAAQLRLATGEE